jgi:hypothetical protein
MTGIMQVAFCATLKLGCTQQTEQPPQRRAAAKTSAKGMAYKRQLQKLGCAAAFAAQVSMQEIERPVRVTERRRVQQVAVVSITV